MLPNGALAVVVAGGVVTPSPPVLAALRSAELIVAADSGALALEATGFTPHLVIGDFDSLPPDRVHALRDKGVEVLAWDPHKDFTDGELALREAVARGYRNLALLGWLGGSRPDHMLANLQLLAAPEFAGVCIRVLHQDLTISVVRSHLELDGEPGALVSLLPIAGPARGVRLAGFEYPLAGETLWPHQTRGVSNRLLGHRARVTVEDGVVLLFQYPAGYEGEPD